MTFVSKSNVSPTQYMTEGELEDVELIHLEIKFMFIKLFSFHIITLYKQLY